MSNTALPASPGFVIEQELDAAFPIDQIAPASDAAPDSGLLSNSPEEAGAPFQDHQPSNPLFESFSSAMQSQGFQTERLADARAWLDALQGEPLENVSIAHGFDVSGYRDVFNEQDQPILTSFLNHAARVGWEQEDINNAIAWYLDAFSDTGPSPDDVREALQAERDIEQLDNQDREHARGALSETWGEEFDANRTLINSFLDKLPESQRLFYESAGSDGRLRLNDPEILSRLAQESRTQTPPSLTEAAKQYGSERTALEQMMANRNSPYWRGPDAVALQARYRDLLSAGDEQPKSLPQGSGIAAELAQIEHVMRADFHRYRRDEKMQERYRQLLTIAGG